MIETLSPELEARLPEIAQQWIDQSLSTAPLDRDKIKNAVQAIYKATALRSPDTILWVASPLYGQIVAKILLNKGLSYWENLEGLSLEDLKEEYAKVKKSIGTKFQDDYVPSCYGQFDSYWVAFYTTLIEAGVVIDNQDWLDGMVIMTEAGWWIPFDDFAIVCERPVEIHLNDEGVLHNENGPALSYSDGWGVYSIQGTRVPKWVIEEPEKITPKTIFDESNQEIRRVMCEIYGWANLTSYPGFELIDEQPDVANDENTLRLYKAPDDLFPGVGTGILICTNATPERDGRIRKFGLTVPPDITDAITAVAWTFDKTKEQYLELSRAT